MASGLQVITVGAFRTREYVSSRRSTLRESKTVKAHSKSERLILVAFPQNSHIRTSNPKSRFQLKIFHNY